MSPAEANASAPSIVLNGCSAVPSAVASSPSTGLTAILPSPATTVTSSVAVPVSSKTPVGVVNLMTDVPATGETTRVPAVACAAAAMMFAPSADHATVELPETTSAVIATSAPGVAPSSVSATEIP